MTNWVKADQISRDRAGFVQWYLFDEGVVGEVVLMSEELGTYYAELVNGRGLRYFTDMDVAKDWLWAFYHLERAS